MTSSLYRIAGRCPCLRGSLVQFFLQRPDFFKDTENLFSEGAVNFHLGVLGNVADSDAVITSNSSLSSVLFSHEHSQKRGLATSVGADDADSSPFIDV